MPHLGKLLARLARYRFYSSFFMDHPFYTTVKTDFSAVDVLIKSSLVTRVPLVEEISTYLIEAGGKRLRPLLVLLAAKACNYQQHQHMLG